MKKFSNSFHLRPQEGSEIVLFWDSKANFNIVDDY